VSWNPDQYERFKAERKQPFTDLLALVERRPNMRVLDLGCGTGELTREMHETLGARETIGVDNSETMLAKARTGVILSAAEREGSGRWFERTPPPRSLAVFAAQDDSSTLEFRLGDIESFVPDLPFDLIFSNAALQWVRNHHALLTRLAGFLAPNGQIAIQMPANDDHPSHATAAEVARSFGVEPRHDPLLPIDEYARLLDSLGFRRQNVRMQVYGHELESAESVIEWVKGTLLTDYEKRLGTRYPQFLAEYSKTLLPRLGSSRPFFYTYKRVLILGKDRV
jgi:trans-aconitate 2-methyltransferase